MNNDDKLSLSSGIPDFIVKLYKMLMENRNSNIISWSDAGNSFVIRDISEFTKSLLPLTFKHGNFASFVRQLNKYDFHKLKSDDSKKLGPQVWEFSHSNFQRDQPGLLSLVKRKSPSTKSDKKAQSPDSSALDNFNSQDSEIEILKTKINYMENIQMEMSRHLKSLSLQSQQMMDQIGEFRQKVLTQDQIIHYLIQYLPNEKMKSQSDLSNFPESSSLNIPNTENLDFMINPKPNQNLNTSKSKNTNFNISFQSVVDPFNLQSKPLDLNSLAQSVSPGIDLGPLGIPSKPVEKFKTSTRGAFSSWSTPPKVLLVEDDDTCRRLSSKLLQIFGCNFDIAVDGLDAVNRMNVGCKYDLVLMDIMMPNLDGVSATTRIRQFDQLTPIISMTSNITENDCMTYLANGMNDILVKPFNKSTLLGMINRHFLNGNSTSTSDNSSKIVDISSVIPPPLSAPIPIGSQLMDALKMDSSFLQPESSLFEPNKRFKSTHDQEAEKDQGSSI